jgi:nitrogen regulatory protein P-II 1
MKQVTAYLREEKFSALSWRLHGAHGPKRLRWMDVRGSGGGRKGEDVDRLAAHPEVASRCGPEAVCRDDLVDAVVEAICAAAHTGRKGDGKITSSPVEDAVRISTRERGEVAV